MTRKIKSLSLLRIAILLYAIISTIVDLATGMGIIYLFYGLSLCLVIIAVPSFFRLFKVQISDTTLFVGFIFCTIAIYTGNRFDLYKNLWWYDAALHFTSGIIVSLAAFDIFFKRETTKKLPIAFIAIVILLFSISVAAVWEIVEFLFDIVTEQDVQRNLIHEREILGAAWQNTGVKDIMNDMILGTIGGVIGMGVVIFQKKKNL